MKTILFLIAFIATGRSLADTGKCAQELDRIGGSILGVRVPFIKTPSRFGFAQANDIGTSKDLFLGIDTIGHAYFVVNSTRFDGGAFFFGIPSRVRETTGLSEGIALKIENIPQKNLDDLEAYLKTNPFVFSEVCIAGVCRVLKRRAGLVNLSPRFMTRYSTSLFLRRVLSQGIYLSDGTRLPVTPYLIGVDNLSDARRGAIFYEMALHFGFPGAIGSLTYLISLLTH